MSSLEEAIRERAYQLWIADGQPEGRAEIHWLNAQREILAWSVESAAQAAAAAEPAVVTPAKKARSRKRKARAA